MITFSLNRETLILINSQRITGNKRQLCNGDLSLDIIEKVIDNDNTDEQKVRAIARLGVCLALIHQTKCTTNEQFEKFLTLAKEGWNFRPNEFHPLTFNDDLLLLMPLEYAFRFSTNFEFIKVVMNNTQDKEDVFFSKKVYDTLDIDRKKMFINNKLININHQHSSEYPSLILNRVFMENDILELNELLALGPKTRLVDDKLQSNFFQIVRAKLTDEQLLELIKNINHITSFHLLLYTYETITNPYLYEGLYFTFNYFYKYKDDIDFEDVMRYLSIIEKCNLGDENENKEKYIDTFIYSSFIKYMATIKVHNNNNEESLQRVNEIINNIYNHYSNSEIIKHNLKDIVNSQSVKRSESIYRINPTQLFDFDTLSLDMFALKTIYHSVVDVQPID